MALVLKGFQSFTCPPTLHLESERAIPAFAFPALAGILLLTPEGWKAELAWLVGYVVMDGESGVLVKDELVSVTSSE